MLRTKMIRTTALAGISFLGMLATANAQLTNPNITSYSPFIPSYPGGGFGVPLAFGGELVASGGDVTVTYLGYGGASYNEYLFIDTPGGSYSVGTPLMENHTTPAGLTLDLGTFSAGEEVEFGIYVYDTGNTWYDGPGSRNADGAVHANIVNNFSYTLFNGDSGTGTYVGFEDEAYDNYYLNGGFYDGDFNYGDLQYVFNGVQGTSSAPDAGTTMGLLGMGLTGLGMFARRLRK